LAFIGLQVLPEINDRTRAISGTIARRFSLTNWKFEMQHALVVLFASIAVLSFGTADAQPATWHGLSAEELTQAFPPDKIYAGVRIKREDCERLKLAVWVEHRYGSECIRYFPSGKIEGASRAVFFFHGDVLDGRNPLPGASVNNSVGGKLKEVQGLGGANGVPFIAIARPGVFGSSGAHADRRRPKEFHSLNAAVDAIKARYRIGEIILSGQSGGATAVGALLTMGRTDVACAVASSGGYDVLGRAMHRGVRRIGCDTTLHCDSYNVTDFTSGVVQNPARRIFIIGDPLDSNTPFSFQKAFADKLRAAGHDVVVVEATGEGPEHHRLAHMATRAAGWCNAGLPTEEIVAKIQAGEYALFDARRRKAAAAVSEEPKE
jgi:hypothetical protein